MTDQNFENIVIKYRDIKTSGDAKIVQINIWSEAVLYETRLKPYSLEKSITKFLGAQGETIRFVRNIQKGYKPSRKNSSRSVDLVKVIDDMYGLTELKNMFYSPFWYVLSKNFANHAGKPGNIRLIMAEIFAICSHNSKDSFNTDEDKIYFKFKEPIRFNRIKPAIKKFKIPACLLGDANFDQLALLGVMYREAYIGCSIEYAMAIRELFLVKLYEILSKPFIKKNRKIELFNLILLRILTPISQMRRYEADGFQKSFRKTKIILENNNEVHSFLKSHDKSVRVTQIEEYLAEQKEKNMKKLRLKL